MSKAYNVANEQSHSSIIDSDNNTKIKTEVTKKLFADNNDIQADLPPTQEELEFIIKLSGATGVATEDNS